jgi:hypothetical protein
MFSDTLSFLSSLNVSDQVSHPYKTTGKIIVLFILIFKILDSNLEDKKFSILFSLFFFLWNQTDFILKRQTLVLKYLSESSGQPF